MLTDTLGVAQIFDQQPGARRIMRPWFGDEPGAAHLA